MKIEEIKEFCNDAIELNETMQGCYFWNPPSKSSARRKYEEEHSLKGEFEYKEHKYYVNLITECSCKNVYFKQYIEVDGESKDIRLIKKILKEIKLDECKEKVEELLKEEKKTLSKREYNKIFKYELSQMI